MSLIRRSHDSARQLNTAKDVIADQNELLRGSLSQSQDVPHTVFLLDIEGTTTPLPFVTQVLFPAADTLLESFIKECEASPAGNPDMALYRKCLGEASTEAGITPPDTLSTEAFAALLRRLMSENSKVPYLKELQGAIWRRGYVSGNIKGHVFDDAAVAIRTWGALHWRNDGVAVPASTSVEIYSSGSVTAQKLLFEYSTQGDLTPCLSGFHDPTTAGPKVEASSYKSIRSAISAKHPEGFRIVFLTDSVAEVEAAVKSDSIDVVIYVFRPMNAALTDQDIEKLEKLGIPCLFSFEQLLQAVKGDTLPALWKEVGEYTEGMSLKKF